MKALVAGALLFLLTTLSTTAAAQAWIRRPGSAYINLSYRFIAADEFYGADGKRKSIRDFTQHLAAFYGDLGLIERWLMLTFGGELFRRSTLPDQGATQGLGDLQLGAWTGLLTTPLHLSFGVVMGLPTGDPTPMAGGLDSQAERIARSLPTGDGEWDVTLRLAAGHGFAVLGLSCYAVAGLGYAIRTKGFLDQIVYRAELGGRLARPIWDRFALILRVSGAESLGDNSMLESFAGVGNGISYTAYGVEVAARMWRTLGLSFGIASLFRGENLVAAPAYKFSIGYEL